MLTDSLKKFLEKNVELLDANNFKELYRLSETELYFSQEIGTLTRTLLSAGINPINHLKWIPYSYLYGDSSITSINIPDSIEFIDSEAFADCSALESVTLGKKVSVIYYGAFEKCSNLTSVKLNEGLLEIGQYAFRGTGVTELIIPSTVTSIDVQAFPDIITLFVYPGSYAHEWAITNDYNVGVLY